MNAFQTQNVKLEKQVAGKDMRLDLFKAFKYVKQYCVLLPQINKCIPKQYEHLHEHDKCHTHTHTHTQSHR